MPRDTKPGRPYQERTVALASGNGSPSLPTSSCPVCRYEMDSATCLDKESAQPSSGDVTVCLNCGEQFYFNDILVLKPITQEVLTDLDSESRELLSKASALIKKRGRLR